MNVNKRFLKFVAGLSALSFTAFLPSCEKEQEDTKEYLNGEVSIGYYDVFVRKRQNVTYYPTGVTHPEGHDMGMYYKISDVMSVYDTVYRAGVNPIPTEKGKASFNAIYPDSLGTFSMYVTIYPIDSDKYYAASTTFYITTVDREGSIPQVATDINKPNFYDTRDEEMYNYVEVDGLYWMTQNLRYSGPESQKIGAAYFNCEAARPVFGAYYTWKDAINACPPDWRLPSNADWLKLAKAVSPSSEFSESSDFRNVAGDFMVDAYFNRDKMWEFWPKVKITNKLGLSLIPCGYYNSKTREDFKGMTEYGCYWTSDENPLDTKLGLFRYIYGEENDVKLGTADKESVAMSVRCVKNKPIDK